MFKKLAAASSAVITLGVALTSPAQAAVFFDTVISRTPGTGNGVYKLPDSTYVGPVGTGTFAPTAVTALDGASWALGGGGSIVLGFSDGSSFNDIAGNDLAIYDSFGLRETVNIQLSNDGVSWSSLSGGPFGGPVYATSPSTSTSFGTTYETLIDIASAGLASAKFLKLTAVGNVGGYPEAFDLDAVKAISVSSRNVPEPATILGIVMVAGFGFATKKKRASV